MAANRLKSSNLEGGCACGEVRYELRGSPMIVHACHCTSCQRRGGGAFAVNAVIEADNVVLKSGELRTAVLHDGESGKPCDTWFCSKCGTGVWVRYHAAPGDCRFVRAGTLDDPSALQPDAHIYTRSKQDWIDIPPDARSYEVFYDIKEVWPTESLARLRKNIETSEPLDRDD